MGVFLDTLPGGQLPGHLLATLQPKTEEPSPETSPWQSRRTANQVIMFAPTRLRNYAGVYESALYGKIEIREESGKLTLRFGTRFVGEVSHWHYDTSRFTSANPLLDEWMVSFRLNTRGEVHVLHVQETPWVPSYMEAVDLGEFRRVPG